MSSMVEQAQRYHLRSTVGPSVDVDVTTSEVTHTLSKPGLYKITNLGPNPCNLRMFPTTSGSVTTSDDIVPPSGSDGYERFVTIGSPGLSVRSNFMGHGMPPGDRVIHAICAIGTAKLRVTEMSRI